MKFENMEKAIAYMLETTPGGEIFYKNDFYSCVVSETKKIHAAYDWESKSVIVTGETWDKGRDFNEPYVSFDRKNVCRLTFDKLRSERKYDAALRLASAMISGDSIQLGLGDTDWEIQTALSYCGCEPSTISRFMATMSLEGTIKLPNHIFRRLKVEFYD